MRNTSTRLTTLAAAAAVSFATLLFAAPARADHGWQGGHGYGPGYGPGPAVRYGHAYRPYPAPYRTAGTRRGYAYNGYGAYAAYPGWRPAPAWIEGRWVLPPWPGAAWRAGFYSPRGLWIAGGWR